MTINHQSALNNRCLYDKLYSCIIRNLDFKINTGNKECFKELEREFLMVTLTFNTKIFAIAKISLETTAKMICT